MISLLLSFATSLALAQSTPTAVSIPMKTELTSLNISSVSLIFKVGTLADPIGKEGTAMLTGNALITGSTKRDAKKLQAELDLLGASIGVSVSETETTFTVTALNENLKAAVELLCELLVQPAFEAHEVEILKAQATASANRLMLQPPALVKALYQGALFQGTALARQSNGYATSLASIDAIQLGEFAKSHYTLDRLAVVASAQMLPSPLESLLKVSLQALPAQATQAWVFPTVAAPTGVKVYYMVKNDSKEFNVMMGSLAPSLKSTDRWAISLGSSIFGSGMDSWMFEYLRKQTGWSYVARGSVNMGPDIGSYVLWTTPMVSPKFPNVLADSISKQLEIMDRFVNEGPQKDEFERARNAQVLAYPFAMRQASQRMALMQADLLYGIQMPSRQKYESLIQALTPADLKRVFASIFDTKNLVIAIVGNEQLILSQLATLKGISSVQKVNSLEELH